VRLGAAFSEEQVHDLLPGFSAVTTPFVRNPNTNLPAHDAELPLPRGADLCAKSAITSETDW
jgi:hypothetical protein